MAEEKKEETAEAPKKSFPLQKILMLLFFLSNLVAMGGGGFLVYQSTLGFERKPIREDALKKEMANRDPAATDYRPILYTLDPFIVNLDGRPRRTIKTIMTIELIDEKGFEEAVNLGARSRDEIVRLLNGKKFVELETLQGKLYFKDEVARILNRHMNEGVVKDIYFSEFVAQ